MAHVHSTVRAFHLPPPPVQVALLEEAAEIVQCPNADAGCAHRSRRDAMARHVQHACPVRQVNGIPTNAVPEIRLLSLVTARPVNASSWLAAAECGSCD